MLKFVSTSFFYCTFLSFFPFFWNTRGLSHSIVQIRNSVMWDRQHSMEYSFYLDWIWGIFCGIMLVPHNIVMDLNYVMDHLASFLSCREMIWRPGIKPPTTPFGLGTSPLPSGSLWLGLPYISSDNSACSQVLWSLRSQLSKNHTRWCKSSNNFKCSKMVW